jgi:hypothetical protein
MGDSDPVSVWADSTLRLRDVDRILSKAPLQPMSALPSLRILASCRDVVRVHRRRVAARPSRFFRCTLGRPARKLKG